MGRRLLLLALACFLVFSAAAAETPELTVSLPETVKGYTPCEIVITSPAAGEAELKLLDPMQNLWLTRREQISEGKNVIPWDGLGEFGERMFAGPYRFLVKVTAADGTELSVGTDPLNMDSGGDGLNDGIEQAIGTDPLQPDSDEDGMPDGWEHQNGFDPTTHYINTTRTDDDALAVLHCHNAERL